MRVRAGLPSALAALALSTTSRRRPFRYFVGSVMSQKHKRHRSGLTGSPPYQMRFFARHVEQTIRYQPLPSLLTALNTAYVARQSARVLRFAALKSSST